MSSVRVRREGSREVKSRGTEDLRGWGEKNTKGEGTVKQVNPVKIVEPQCCKRERAHDNHQTRRKAKAGSARSNGL